MIKKMNTLECIHCQSEIILGRGLAPGITLQSIQLQAREIGVEIHCDECKEYFILDDTHSSMVNPHSLHNFANRHESNTPQADQKSWKWC